MANAVADVRARSAAKNAMGGMVYKEQAAHDTAEEIRGAMAHVSALANGSGAAIRCPCGQGWPESAETAGLVNVLQWADQHAHGCLCRWITAHADTLGLRGEVALE